MFMTKKERALARLGHWVYAGEAVRRKVTPEVYEVYKVTHAPILKECIEECFKVFSSKRKQ